MNSWGVLNSFGVFEAYYSQQLIPEEPPSKIAWIGSMQAFLLFVVGVLTGPLIDAGYLRSVMLSGTFLITFGMMMTSLCSQYYQLMLAQGILVGLGFGLTFVPSIAVLPQYVSPKHRGTLLGVVATGSSVGGIIYPIMFHYIERSAGFGWATRAIGFVVLATNIPASLVLRNRVLPPAKRQLFDFPMIRETPFLLLMLAYFFCIAALYIPIFFLQSYAETTAHINPQLSFFIVSIINAGSLPGRVIPNMIGAKMGELNVLTGIVTCAAILAFCWIAVKSSTAGIIVFALLYGFSAGGCVSLIPPVVFTTAPNMVKLSTRMGMAMAMMGFGVFLGSPVGGAILQNTGRYLATQLFTGSMLMVSAALLLLRKLLFRAKPEG